MEKIHRSRPEPVLFLLAARDAMVAYQKKVGNYAAEWHLLDITYACGPYRITDPDIRPQKTNAALWKPRNCKLSYEITRATDESFRILAKDSGGKVVYGIEAGGDPIQIDNL